MDELLITLSSYSKILLPILGCIVIILILLLLRKAMKFVDGLNLTLNRVNKTLDTVDKSLDQLQVPLNTVVTISHTIDTVHSYGSKAINEMINFIVENVILIKEWLAKVLNKEKTDVNNVDINVKEEDTYVE